MNLTTLLFCHYFNPETKQIYIDGHFCYAYKIGNVTNDLSIIRHIDFYNKAFDSIRLYKELLSGDTFGTGRHFEKAYILLNARVHLENLNYTINEDRIACCPNIPSLPMKCEGIYKLKSSVTRYKFVCSKVVEEKDLRAYPDVMQGTDEWNQTYKTRTYVERFINHIKDCFCLAGRKTQNEKTLHAELIFASITQLTGVVLAVKIHKHEYIRTLKSLIA